MARLLSTIFWPLVLVFLPTWLGNLAPGGGTHLEWNPLAIAMAWPASLSALWDYSASFCIGALVTLALCLWWYARRPSVFYGLLLFFAACMASPSWVVVARFWHYVQGAPPGPGL